MPPGRELRDTEPRTEQANAFIDGQNLFHAAKEAFGCRFPNYDPLALARAVSRSRGWELGATFFYTGVPESGDNPLWSGFWSARPAVVGTRGVRTFPRSLRYRNQPVALRDGSTRAILIGHEKGIDVRLALDVVRRAGRPLRRRAHLQPGSGPLGGCGGSPSHRCPARTVAQGGLHVPPQPDLAQPPRDRPNRLDPDRPGKLRPIP